MALTKVGKEGITGISNSSDAAAITIDSSERVGIGTASPTTTLQVGDGSADTRSTFNPSSAFAIGVKNGSSHGGFIGSNGSSGMQFSSSGGAARMTITSDGNVGIGCTPTTKFQVQGASNANNIEIAGDYIQSFNRSGSPGYQSLPIFASDFKLYTAGSERVRIDASGNVLVGSTSFSEDGSTNSIKIHPDEILTGTTSSSANTHLGFSNPNGRVGSIVTNGSSTLFNTSSDHRLKEAVVDMTGAIDRVKALAPKRFNFIADPDDTTVDGFLAHEAQAVVPEAVTGTHNETRTFTNVVLSSDGKLLAQDVAQADWTAGKLATTDVNGNAVDALYPSDSTWSASHDGPVMQGIDQSKLVPLLTGALREAIAKIETLDTQRADLEARLAALESA